MSLTESEQNFRSTLDDIFARLWRAYGPQGWWPGSSREEIIIGAILTQNTAWANVQRALANLAEAGCLHWERLRKIEEKELAERIRPSGTFRIKARRLKAFVDCLWDKHGGSLDSMLVGDADVVRARLLRIHGIGLETADAILLYVGKRASFVVDAYTRRVLLRHFLLDGRESYETVRNLFHRAYVTSDGEVGAGGNENIRILSRCEPNEGSSEEVFSDAVRLFNEYHALIVKVGKEHCRARANCTGCPLESLPHDAERRELLAC